MHFRALAIALTFCFAAAAAELESRQFTHYLPQDFLETVVRKQNWTEVVLDVKTGLHKGDTVRIWAGGSIDRGNGDEPGVNVNGPEGVSGGLRANDKAFALSSDPAHPYALLVKTESTAPARCLPAGKPLEIKMSKDKEKVWIGFNDEKDCYQDNHLGKGRRHETDPLWVRIEVVRTVVD